jgi:hypothetical protein
MLANPRFKTVKVPSLFSGDLSFFRPCPSMPSHPRATAVRFIERDERAAQSVFFIASNNMSRRFR